MFPSIIKGHIRKQYHINITTKSASKIRHRVQKNGETVLVGESYMDKTIRLTKITQKKKSTWIGFVVENNKVVGIVKPVGLKRYEGICGEYDQKHKNKNTSNASNEELTGAYKHTRHRLSQRFHLEITKDEYNALCDKLSNLSFWDRFGIKKLKGNLIGMWYKCKWVVFAFDAVKKIIRTAYPAHSKNAFGKKWFENSQKAPLLYRLFTPNFSIV